MKNTLKIIHAVPDASRAKRISALGLFEANFPQRDLKQSVCNTRPRTVLPQDADCTATEQCLCLPHSVPASTGCGAGRATHSCRWL